MSRTALVSVVGGLLLVGVLWAVDSSPFVQGILFGHKQANIASTQTPIDAATLAGHPGLYYLDAGNLTGTLSTDRFSAYQDLQAEGKIGKGSTIITDQNLPPAPPVAPNPGTITGVKTGLGLVGGGATGTVTVALNPGVGLTFSNGQLVATLGNAIDLNGNETVSILPVAKGGTGLSSPPPAGAVLVGTGVGYTYGLLSDGDGTTLITAAGQLSYNVDASVCRTSGNCSGAGGGVVGSGTAGFLSRFTAAGTIGDSLIFDDGSHVGIGTNTPTVSLENNGDFITKGPWYDVRAFGAKADGVTDDQPAIEAAIAAAHAAGGGVVYLPRGTYEIGATIHLQSNVTLAGSGIGATTIRSTDLPTDPLSFGSTPQILAREVTNTAVEAMTVQLESSATTSIAGISFDAASNSTVTDTELVGQRKPALRANPGSDTIRFQDNYVHDTLQAGTGILVDDYPASGYSSIQNIFIVNNRVDRVQPDSAQGGIAVWSSSGATANNIVIDGNIVTNAVTAGGPGNGIRVYMHTAAGGVDRVAITNNVVSGNDSYGVNISGAGGPITNLTVTNNTLTGNTLGPLTTGVLNNSSTWHIGSNTGDLNLDYFGNVGVGTSSPVSKLAVNGSVAIGTYAGTTAAPSNGLIVSGSVGIGTASTTNTLTVNGGIDFSAASFTGTRAGIWSPATGELGLVANGTTALRISSTGNVGLGISTGISSKLTFAADTTAAGGLLFGTDTTLYRSGSASLKTDGLFSAGGGLAAQGLTTLQNTSSADPFRVLRNDGANVFGITNGGDLTGNQRAFVGTAQPLVVAQYVRAGFTYLGGWNTNSGLIGSWGIQPDTTSGQYNKVHANYGVALLSSTASNAESLQVSSYLTSSTGIGLTPNITWSLKTDGSASNTTTMLIGQGTGGANGAVLQLNAGATGTPTLQFGSNGTFDTNLYRIAANQLATDGVLRVAGQIGLNLGPSGNAATGSLSRYQAGAFRINASSTYAIAFNADGGAGTGGVQFYSGGASPTQVALLDATGKLSLSAGLVIGGGTEIKKHLSATTAWDPPSVTTAAATSTTVTVTGATMGDTVDVGFSSGVPAGMTISGSVTAANTVTVTIGNLSGSTQDLPSGTLRADIWQH